MRISAWIDGIGLLPVATAAAEGLYRVVDAAYEKRSIAISSNLHPASFDELMPKTLAGKGVRQLSQHTGPVWPSKKLHLRADPRPYPGIPAGRRRADNLTTGGQKLMGLDNGVPAQLMMVPKCRGVVINSVVM